MTHRIFAIWTGIVALLFVTALAVGAVVPLFAPNPPDVRSTECEEILRLPLRTSCHEQPVLYVRLSNIDVASIHEAYWCEPVIPHSAVVCDMSTLPICGEQPCCTPWPEGAPLIMDAYGVTWHLNAAGTRRLERALDDAGIIWE